MGWPDLLLQVASSTQNICDGAITFVARVLINRVVYVMPERNLERPGLRIGVRVFDAHLPVQQVIRQPCEVLDKFELPADRYTMHAPRVLIWRDPALF